MGNPEECETALTIPNRAKMITGTLLATAAMSGNLVACGENDNPQSATNGAGVELANPKGDTPDSDQPADSGGETIPPHERNEPFSAVTKTTVEAMGVDYSHSEEYGPVSFNFYGDNNLLPENTFTDNLNLFSAIEFPLASMPEDQREYAELFLEGLNSLDERTDKTNVDVILEPSPDKCLVDPLGTSGPVVGRQDEPGSGSCDDAFGFTYELGSGDDRRYLMAIHYVDPDIVRQRHIGNGAYSLPGTELIESTVRHEMAHLLIRLGKMSRGLTPERTSPAHGTQAEEAFAEILEENFLNLQR